MPAENRDPSLNALKHGCTSRRRLLPNESEEEWKVLAQAWLEDYQPFNDNFRSLVLEAVDLDWDLRRKQRAYDDLLYALYSRCEDPTQWTEAEHKQLQLFTRYRTAAERSLQRTRAQLESIRRNRHLEEHRRQLLELARAKEQRLSEKPAAAAEKEGKPAAAASTAAAKRDEDDVTREYLDEVLALMDRRSLEESPQ